MQELGFIVTLITYVIGCFAVLGFGYLCFAAARWFNRH